MSNLPGAEVHLGQSARQLCHACYHCRTGGGPRHLLVSGGYSVSCRVLHRSPGLSERDAGSEDNQKQREHYVSNGFADEAVEYASQTENRRVIARAYLRKGKQSSLCRIEILSKLNNA